MYCFQFWRENSTTSPTNPPTSWGRINSGRSEGLFGTVRPPEFYLVIMVNFLWTLTLCKQKISCHILAKRSPIQKYLQKSQGGYNLNRKCFVCWEHSKAKAWLYFCSIFSFLVCEGCQQSEGVWRRATCEAARRDFTSKAGGGSYSPNLWKLTWKHQLRIVEFKPGYPSVSVCTPKAFSCQAGLGQ